MQSSKESNKGDYIIREREEMLHEIMTIQLAKNTHIHTQPVDYLIII